MKNYLQSYSDLHRANGSSDSPADNAAHHQPGSNAAESIMTFKIQDLVNWQLSCMALRSGCTGIIFAVERFK